MQFGFFPLLPSMDFAQPEIVATDTTAQICAIITIPLATMMVTVTTTSTLRVYNAPSPLNISLHVYTVALQDSVIETTTVFAHP